MEKNIKFNQFEIPEGTNKKLIVDIAQFPNGIPDGAESWTVDMWKNYFDTLGIQYRNLDKEYKEYTTHETDKDPTRFREEFQSTLERYARFYNPSTTTSTPNERVYQAQVEVAPNTIPVETIHRGLVDDIMRSMSYEELKKLFPLERVDTSATSSRPTVVFKVKFKTIKRRR